MTALLVIANVVFAGVILAGLAAVCRFGHRLGQGHHDHLLLSLPRHRREPELEREAA